MRLSRSPQQRMLRPCLFALLASLTVSGAAQAQTNAQQPASVPAATPVPANQFPSVPTTSASPTDQAPQQQPQQPATPPQATAPSTEPTTAAPANKPATPNQDELEKPVQVPSAPAQQPVYMPPASPVASVPSMPAYGPVPGEQTGDSLGSTYIPVDSPIYPMAMRLYSMGYLDSAFISMRPWTRRSLLHMLEKTSADVTSDGDPQAEAILARLQEYLAEETPGNGYKRGSVYGIQSVYTRLMGIGGPTLRDSYHLGQTIVNDYGRPYGSGFNNITGFSSVNEYGRFSLYVRGEYQHSASHDAYPFALASALSCGAIDEICPFAPPNDPQSTIPYGNTGAQNNFRLQEANLSFHGLGHEVSFGKSDAWMGPGMGGGMAWSNNAEDMYTFRINRVEPLRIPIISSILGPVRYDFFVGSLKGHSAPNDPWAHGEMFAFRPTKNFEFGFERTVIWGGKGHGCLNTATGVVTPCSEPITLHTFFKSFFDLSDTTEAEKYSRDDPGARYSAFNFSWRLPFLRKYVTLYTDAISHDDVTPVSAPRRAAYRPGVYISHIPHAEKFDFRIEGANTDISTLRSLNGQFNYFEIVQKQGYTNNGFIMGDWIGREAKGGQAWVTYHMSPDEWVQVEYLNKKTPKDFIPLGTTQNQFKVDVVKRFRKDIELNAWLQYEAWKAPIYKTGQQKDTTVAVQVRFFPKLHTQAEVVGK